MQMMDAAAQDKFKALWAIGYDVLLTNANTASTRRALGNMELVIVQDMFLNETARDFATVFLPAASSFEKDGTFMNAERRIQRVRKVIRAARQRQDRTGKSSAPWRGALGKGDLFNYDSAEEIWNEVRRVWKAGSGISYDRIDQAGLQWPCPVGRPPRNTNPARRELSHRQESQFTKRFPTKQPRKSRLKNFPFS